MFTNSEGLKAIGIRTSILTHIKAIFQAALQLLLRSIPRLGQCFGKTTTCMHI